VTESFRQFVRRWGISLASLVGGLLTLFVFRRELSHVRWIVGYVLLLWLLFALITQVRRTLESSEKRAARLVVTGVDYTIQTLYHGILLFLLPAYWASTTLTSRNALFFAVLTGLTLLATFDPWYRAIMHPRPWVGSIFFFVCVFGALDVALPLVGFSPRYALMVSAWVAVVALAPALCLARRWPWRRSLGVSAFVAFLVAWVAYAGRAWLPPVPLSVADRVLAWNVGSIDSLEPITRAIKAADLRERGLVAYTAVYAPAGLEQGIQHVWQREGEVVDVVSLSPVHGGRREGFRTFSRKTAFPDEVAGRWSVDVMTDSGQLIGRLRFRVIP
jgi:hypothetical protein